MKDDRKLWMAASFPRWLWLLPLVVIPAIVAFHVWRTLEMLDTQRELYLRNRVAALAARMETLSAEALSGDAPSLDALYDEEPSLLDARVLASPQEDSIAAEILFGRRLFQIEHVELNGQLAVRAWFPVHLEGGLRVVRLDFSASAADFLDRYAWQSIGLVALIATALVGLSVYAFRMAAKTAELERRNAEVEHLARLGEMSAVLAHEIRNPLGSIKGFGQLLAESSEGRQKGFAGEIVEQSTRLERLVNDLLLYGRVPEPRWETVRWNDLAERLERSWNEAAVPANVALCVERSNGELRTDPALLEQAMQNLIRNAREAFSAGGERPASGEVAVRFTQSGGASAITVEDDGPGLSGEARARMFEPFFTTKSFGTGLGLPITQKLLAALGCELRLEAENGRGLRATIHLPTVSRELDA